MDINKKFIVFLVPIELFTLIKIILPFLRYNNLNVWDMIGHYSLAWYIQDFLFPRAIGWNPFFYAGYPQGQFYPFLFHYLAAIAGFIFGSELGFKIVLSISILLAPIAFYYFARKFGFSTTESSFTMLIMWILLFFPREHIGGNFFSTFHNGMLTNMFAIPLLFFYLGKLNESFKTGRYVTSSILFGLITLTHIFTAVISVIAIASFLLAKPKSARNLIFVFKHVTLSSLLTAFWIIPFLSTSNYSYVMKILGSDGISIFLYASFVVFITIFFIFSREVGEIKPILYLLIILTLAMLFRQHIPVNIHYYRLSMFILLLMPICVVQIFRVKITPVKIITATPVLMVMVSLILVSLTPMFPGFLYPDKSEDLGINPGGVDDIDINFERVDGRVLVISLFGTNPSYHTYNLVPMNTKNCILRGLFIQSSIHGLYTSAIQFEFEPHTFLWGAPAYTLDIPAENKTELIQHQLDIFNINYIFTSKELNWSNKVADSEEIEVLEYAPKITDEVKLIDFFIPGVRESDKQVLRLLNSSENTSRIIVYSTNPSTETLKTLKRSKDLDYIKFETGSNETAVIFLSNDFKYYWRSYVNGEEVGIPVYPNHLYPTHLVFLGNGTIELKYEESLLNTLNATLYRNVDVGYKNQTFALYRVGDSKLIEVLNYTPQRIERDWGESVWGWFNSKNISRVMVYSETPLPGFVGTGNETVDIIERSETWEYLKFIVESEKPVPVLIKISEFPNWKAYVNGRETRIYRASPYMMLIYGNGVIELKYEPTIWDRLGMLLSLIGLGWLCFIGIKNGLLRDAIPHIRILQDQGPR
ncbi:MAG: 6-pyruvoyl-tetrahydropterin synthase-related protein [Candidatus Altiarchaeota archaeon]|nr:6-pyruvoyl-tetrahydropterin synthase-related protein [Candidatus Altiarchaeota archaeon]